MKTKSRTTLLSTFFQAYFKRVENAEKALFYSILLYNYIYISYLSSSTC